MHLGQMEHKLHMRSTAWTGTVHHHHHHTHKHNSHGDNAPLCRHMSAGVDRCHRVVSAVAITWHDIALVGVKHCVCRWGPHVWYRPVHQNWQAQKMRYTQHETQRECIDEKSFRQKLHPLASWPMTVTRVQWFKAEESLTQKKSLVVSASQKYRAHRSNWALHTARVQIVW